MVFKSLKIIYLIKYRKDNELFIKKKFQVPISVVFSAQTSDKASCIFFSVFVSRADVASSNSTSTGV